MRHAPRSLSIPPTRCCSIPHPEPSSRQAYASGCASIERAAQNRSWRGIVSLMRKLRRKVAFVIPRVLMLLLCTNCVRIAAACDQIPAGEPFWVRLLDPVSSYRSKPAMRVHAIIAESPRCDGVPMFAEGTRVEGVVKSAGRVGLGFVHETAHLTLQFDRLIASSGEQLDINAFVVEVANARESVKKGVIHGIRATNTPQGRITSRLKHLPTWNPYSDMVLVVYRAAFPIAAEPEIYFPPGTDLRLELALPVGVAGIKPAEPANQDFDHSEALALDEIVRSLPERTSTLKGQDADLLNLVFLGSREQIADAFHTAGWMSSDRNSKGSVLRQFHAFLTLNSYPHAPISKQLLQGQTADSAWEKSFDSYGKRDHLRIWSQPESWQGLPVWASASSHETGAVLSVRQKRFIHHVDANLDEERGKVVRDLTLAGCVDAVHDSQRLTVPQISENATGDELRTNGVVAVVRLKNCSQPVFDSSSTISAMDPQPGNKVTRYIRMQILNFRSDVVRGNFIYGAFDLGRMTVGALRRNHSRKYDAKRMPSSPPAFSDPEPSPVGFTAIGK
jgi:hypothetical protein